MTDARRSGHVHRAIGLGIAAILAPLTGFVVGLFVQGAAGLIVLQIGLAAGAVLLALTCGFAAAAATPTAPSRATLAVRVGIIALAYLAPAAVVIATRLGMKTCSGQNLLGLPWPPAIATAVQVACIALVLLAAAAIVFGFTRPQLRGAAIVMLVYSALSVIPTALVYVLSVYGTPYPGCVPI